MNSRAEDFIGREWVFARIAYWLNDPTAQRSLIIQGIPGSGKTAIAQTIASLNNCSPNSIPSPLARMFKAAHFCRADGGVNSPRTFATAVGSQLSRSLPGFSEASTSIASRLLHVTGVANVGRVESGGNVAGVRLELDVVVDELAYDVGFREPLKELYRGGFSETILIVVDGLDEAVSYSGVPLFRLLGRASDLPPQVRFLITSRPDPRVLAPFKLSERIDLVEDEPSRGADIKRYVTDKLRFVDHISESQKQHILSWLPSKANGVFLYAHLVLSTIVQGRDGSAKYHEQNYKESPPGLAPLYADYLSREVALTDQAWQTTYRPLLGVLCAARYPGLTRHQLERALERDLYLELRACRQLLVADTIDGPYRLFHQSLVDFLISSEQLEFAVDIAGSHLLLSSYYLRFGADWRKADDYGLANLPLHLVLARGFADHCAILTSPRWIQAKLNRMGVGAVAADYDLCDEEYVFRSTKLIRDSIRLSASALARDKSQLYAQLLGRLYDYQNDPHIRRLVATVSADCPSLQPLNQALTGPDTALIHVLQGHSDRINSVCITPDNNHAISASSDRTLKIWALESGTLVRTIEGHRDGINDVAVSPDGRLLLSASGNTAESEEDAVRVWDVENGALIEIVAFHGARVQRVRVGRTGTIACSAGYDAQLWVWDYYDRDDQEKKLQFSLDLTNRSRLDWIDGLEISEDCSLAFAADSYFMQVWNLNARKKVHEWKAPHGIACFALSAGAALLAISGFGVRGLNLVDAKTFAVIGTFDQLDSGIKSVLFLPKSAYLIVGTEDGTIMIGDFNTQDWVARLDGHSGSVESLAASGDGRLILSGSRDCTIRVWDVTKAIESRDRERPRHSASSVSITADGEFAIVGYESGELRQWRLETGELYRTLLCGRSPLVSVVLVKPNQVAVASADGRVAIWELSRARIKWKARFKKAPSSIRATGNGRYIVAIFEDGPPEVWDIKRGRVRCRAASREYRENEFANPTRHLTTGLYVLDGTDMAVSIIARQEFLLFWQGPWNSRIVAWSTKTGRTIFRREWPVDSLVIGTESGGCGSEDLLCVVEGRLTRLSLATGETLEEFPASIPMGCVDVSGDRKIVAACDGSQLEVRSARNGENRSIFVADDRIVACAVANNGSVAAMTGNGHLLLLLSPQGGHGRLLGATPST